MDRVTCLHYKTAAVSLVLPSSGGFLGASPGAQAANPCYHISPVLSPWGRLRKPMGKGSLSARQLRDCSTCPSLFLSWQLQAFLAASCPGSRQLEQRLGREREEVDASRQQPAKWEVYKDEREAHGLLDSQPLCCFSSSRCPHAARTHAALQLPAF